MKARELMRILRAMGAKERAAKGSHVRFTIGTCSTTVPNHKGEDIKKGTMKKRYTVRFDRDADSGWWVVTVPEIQGCLTQGRSIAEGRRRIREAMALFMDESEAERAILFEDVRLPLEMRRQVRQVAAVRERAERLRVQAQEATRAAVGELTRRKGLSVRDAAEMLGLSFQRVQQLAGSGQAKGSG